MQGPSEEPQGIAARALVKGLSSALGKEHEAGSLKPLAVTLPWLTEGQPLKLPECSSGTGSGAGIKGTIRGRRAADGSSGAQPKQGEISACRCEHLGNTSRF